MRFGVRNADAFVMRKISNRWRRDDGFTLVEALVALSVLTIAIVLTITPVLSGFGVLSDAKLATIASNLAQARVEELRSLDYEDIGYPLGVPEGVLLASETATIQDIDFTVATDIKYFGSINPGENVIPQGGDGVEGISDQGINYKEVTVTVSHHAGAIAPVVMQTILAPPNLAAHEGKANVIVDLIKVEPPSLPTSLAGYPQVVLAADTYFKAYLLAPVQQQIFAGVPANKASFPDEYYRARLGDPGAYEDAVTGWRIHPIDIDIESERAHVGPTQTATIPLRIYRPATIEVRLFEEGGDDDDDDDDLAFTLSGNALLNLDYEGGGSASFTESSSEWTGDGWLVTDLDGAPVVPGLYTFNVIADGYLAQSATDVSVPAGYPADPDHIQKFALDPASGTQIDVTVVDEVGGPIAGADVTFSDFIPLGGPAITIQTDGVGVASYFLDSSVTAVDWEVTSGFHDPSGKNHLNLNDPVEVLNVTLNTPATQGLLTLHEDDPTWVQYFRFRPDGGAPDDWIDVFPNSLGEASVSVDPGAWDVEKVCVKLRGNGNPHTQNSTVNVPANGTAFWSSSTDCPAP